MKCVHVRFLTHLVLGFYFIFFSVRNAMLSKGGEISKENPWGTNDRNELDSSAYFCVYDFALSKFIFCFAFIPFWLIKYWVRLPGTFNFAIYPHLLINTKKLFLVSEMIFIDNSWCEGKYPFAVIILVITCSRFLWSRIRFNKARRRSIGHCAIRESRYASFMCLLLCWYN